MWTKARCLAALRLPDAFTVDVRFKKPILLPSKVTFGEAEDRFAVHGHLEGRRVSALLNCRSRLSSVCLAVRSTARATIEHDRARPAAGRSRGSSSIDDPR